MKRSVERSVAIAYIRVSTTTERQELGAEGQRHAIEQWARNAGVEVGAWLVEEVSGGAPLEERPVLLEAVAAVVERRAGCLVFATLDRFSRDPLAAALVEAELVKAGAELVFADGSGNGSDPTAELVRAIRLAVARFERQMIKARIRAALAVKKRRREMTGSTPYGYRAVPGPTRVTRDGSHRTVAMLEPVAEEQAVIGRARELRASGLSLRAVAAALASEGRTARNGRAFAAVQVARMLAAGAVESAAA